MKLWNFIKENMLKNHEQQICENGAALSFEETAIWAESFAKRLNGVECCAILCSSEMATAMSLLACFAAGVTAAIVGKNVLKSPKTREVFVSGIAKGMQLRDDARETLKNMREDAEDLCYEAKSKMNKAEEADSDEI